MKSDSDFQNAVKEAFIACISLSSVDEQKRYIEVLETESPRLAGSIRDLLKFVKTDASGLEENARPFQKNDDRIDCGTNSSDLELDLSKGMVIGRYKLLEQIGEGGMGTVYMAQQTDPIKRRVALKIVKPGMDSQQVIARFEAERQALALMEHPNIARVFDAGATPLGRPYFVMELVRGVSLTKFCQSKKLSIEERLRLFTDLCNGLQHAHQKGIIHRDIKPSNVLVTLHGDKPVVKIIDFGIAKAINQDLTDATLFTSFSQMMGTPLYMSPEQAENSGLDVDTRSDVYSLGVMLYELITDTTPFDGDSLRKAGVDEIRRIIRETDPPRPSQRLTTKSGTASAFGTSGGRRQRDMHLKLANELDWIIMKAIEKERERRYQSPMAFAEDIQRYLDDEPVAACPPSRAYRWSKMARRNRVALTTSALVFAALVAGLCGTTWQAFRARQAEGLAEERLVLEIAAREQAVAQRNRADLQMQRADEEAERALAEEARATQEAEISTAIAEFLQDDLLDFVDVESQLNADLEPQPDLRVRTLLDRASQRIVGRFENAPLVLASLHNSIGQAYAALGLHASAVPHLEMTVAIWRSNIGTDSLDTMRAIRRLAQSLTKVGRLEEAELLLEEELQMSAALTGEESDDSQRSMMSKVVLFFEMGKYEKARSLSLELVNMCERIHGPSNRLTWNARSSLATQYAKLGQFDKALSIEKDLLELRERKFGLAHPDTLASLELIGVLMNDAGDKVEAEQYIRRAFQGFEELLGNDASKTLECAANLGRVLTLLGRTIEAQGLLESTLRVASEKLGTTDATTRLVQRYLASLYAKQNRPKDAIPLFESLLETQELLLGEGHVSVVTLRFQLAKLKYSVDQSVESEERYRNVFLVAEKYLGPSNNLILKMKNNFALDLKKAKRHKESMILFEEVLAVYQLQFEPNSIKVIGVQFNIGTLLRDTGRNADALSLMTDLASKLNSQPVRDHPLVGLVNMNLGQLLMQEKSISDRYVRAEAAFRDAFESNSRRAGKFQKETLIALESYVAVILLQGETERGIETLRTAISAAVLEHGDLHTTTVSLQRLAARSLVRTKHGEEAIQFFAAAYTSLVVIQRADDAETQQVFKDYIACLQAVRRHESAEELTNRHLDALRSLKDPRKEAIRETEEQLADLLVDDDGK